MPKGVKSFYSSGSAFRGTRGLRRVPGRRGGGSRQRSSSSGVRTGTPSDCRSSSMSSVAMWRIPRGYNGFPLNLTAVALPAPSAPSWCPPGAHPALYGCHVAARAPSSQRATGLGSLPSPAHGGGGPGLAPEPVSRETPEPSCQNRALLVTWARLPSPESRKTQ
jgi:hypothetical protein